MRAAALVVLVTAACGGGAAPPAATSATAPTATTAPDPFAETRAGIERETVLIEDLAKRGCACADAACLEAIDDELGAYYRVGTLNDPMTDIETWPADLDARAQVAIGDLLDCYPPLHVMPYAAGVVALRKLGMLRDAACACRDIPCATAVMTKLREKAERYAIYPVDEQVSAEVVAVVTELGACVQTIQAPMLEQAVLDAKALRKAACACRDATCADDIERSARTYLDTYAGLAGDVTITAELEELGLEVGACLKAARDGAAPAE